MDQVVTLLEQRATHDLMWNRLIAVFLLALKDFVGVLFITTNRCFCSEVLSKLALASILSIPIWTIGADCKRRKTSLGAESDQ
jgi:hypothetical protein